MREKFELCCKVVGLVLFCVGLYTLLGSISVFFGAQATNKLYDEAIWQSLSPGLQEQLKKSTNDFQLKWFLSTFLCSIVPMLLGFYLMRSNNLFVKYCYPTTNTTPIPDTPQNLTLNTQEQAIHKDTQQTDHKYAPPGYYPSDH